MCKFYFLVALHSYLLISTYLLYHTLYPSLRAYFSLDTYPFARVVHDAVDNDAVGREAVGVDPVPAEHIDGVHGLV